MSNIIFMPVILDPIGYNISKLFISLFSIEACSKFELWNYITVVLVFFVVLEISVPIVNFESSPGTRFDPLFKQSKLAFVYRDTL